MGSRCIPHHINVVNHPGQLSLAISSWVGEMSTGDQSCCLRGLVLASRILEDTWWRSWPWPFPREKSLGHKDVDTDEM